MPLPAPRNARAGAPAGERVGARQPTWIIAPVLIALFAGALVGLAAAAFLGHEDAPPAPGDRAVQVGPASVVVSGHWAPVESDAAADRATFRPLPGTDARTRLAIEPMAGPELVPRSLGARLRGSLPSPHASRLAGHPAWTYSDLPTARAGEALGVTVLPTSAGVLSLTCSGPPAVADVVRECASQVLRVTLHGATALAPDPDLPVRLRLPTVLRALDRARVAGRARLRAAATSSAQARAADRLTAAHRRATGTLARLAPRSGRSRAVVDALTATAAAYRRLGLAARAREPRAYARARETVEVRERALARALRSVRG